MSRFSDLTATNLVATSAYGYDSLGRMTSLNHGTASNAIGYAGYTWSFDAASRVRRFTIRNTRTKTRPTATTMTRN